MHEATFYSFLDALIQSHTNGADGANLSLNIDISSCIHELQGRHSSGSTSLSPESPSTLSQSPSSYTAQHPGSLTMISELHEPYQSPGSIEVSSDAVVKTKGMDHLGMKEIKEEVVGSSELEVSQALRRLEMQLSLTDDTVEDIGPFCNEDENSNDAEDIINDRFRSTASLD